MIDGPGSVDAVANEEDVVEAGGRALPVQGLLPRAGADGRDGAADTGGPELDPVQLADVVQVLPDDAGDDPTGTGRVDEGELDHDVLDRGQGGGRVGS